MKFIRIDKGAPIVRPRLFVGLKSVLHGMPVVG
jgi:hypothetical protein